MATIRETILILNSTKVKDKRLFKRQEDHQPSAFDDWACQRNKLSCFKTGHIQETRVATQEESGVLAHPRDEA